MEREKGLGAVPTGGLRDLLPQNEVTKDEILGNLRYIGGILKNPLPYKCMPCSPYLNSGEFFIPCYLYISAL
jgi:hypothetical protein